MDENHLFGLLNIFCSSIDTRGRPGVWHRRKDIHHRRSGDFIRCVHQLGHGSGVLGVENRGTLVRKFYKKMTYTLILYA